MKLHRDRWYRRHAVANAVEFLGCPYTLGGRFLNEDANGDLHGDCRGLYDTSWELLGALAAIGGRHRNVRAMYKDGVDMDLLLPPDAKVKKGDGIIYNEPSAMPGPPGNPLCIRHVAIAEFPISPTKPEGGAISALNPELGVMRHNLPLTKLFKPDGTVKPSHFGLAILNIFRPNLDLLDVSDEPSVDPEPPI